MLLHKVFSKLQLFIFLFIMSEKYHLTWVVVPSITLLSIHAFQQHVIQNDL